MIDLMKLVELLVAYEVTPESSTSNSVYLDLLQETDKRLHQLCEASGRTSEIHGKLELCLAIARSQRDHLKSSTEKIESNVASATERIESLETKIAKVELLAIANGGAIKTLTVWSKNIQLYLPKNSGSVIPMTWTEWLNRQTTKTLIWLVFVVGFALLDIIAAAIYLTFASGQTVSTIELYGKGQLLLVVAAISADAIGHLPNL